MRLIVHVDLGREPAGNRGRSPSAGTLHAGHGMPAPPQPQAAGPSHGIAGWFSHTQKVSMQTGHFGIIAAPRAPLARPHTRRRCSR
jgi:hypothetical protein